MIEQAPIVGREREQQQLLRLLDEACDGVPRFAFVSGEPGIGMTCLLAELLRRADEQECLALGGSAAEFERELPFAPFVDALDDDLDALDPQAFGRLASEDLGELAGVFRVFRSHTSTPLELGTGSRSPGSSSTATRTRRSIPALPQRGDGRKPPARGVPEARGGLPRRSRAPGRAPRARGARLAGGGARRTQASSCPRAPPPR